MTCATCGGLGFCLVRDGYVDKQAPTPAREPGESDEHYAGRVVENDARRAALAKTVYPCRECRPQQFFKWAAGHFGIDHDRQGCPDCRDSRIPGPGTRRRRRGGHDEPPLPDAPPDLDEGPEPVAARGDDWSETRRDLA